MITPGPSAYHNSRRPRILWAAGLLLSLLLSSGCGSVRNADNAPAYGTIGGITAGALVGAASGSTGTGAVIGGMLGRSGGQIVRSERSPSRAVNDGFILRDLPATLKAAAKFDGSLAKEHNTLARRRATSPGMDTELVKAQARGRLSEIQSWIGLMEDCDKTLSRAISSATTYPSDHLGTWLNQRTQVRTRLASLRMHQSWFKSLAS